MPDPIEKDAMETKQPPASVIDEPKEIINARADYESILTEEERQALQAADGGFDFGEGDDFSAEEVSDAKASMVERIKAEATKDDPPETIPAEKPDALQQILDEEKAKTEAVQAEAAKAEESPVVQVDEPEPQVQAPPPVTTEDFLKASEAVEAKHEQQRRDAQAEYDDGKLSSEDLQARFTAIAAAKAADVRAAVGQVAFDREVNAYLKEYPVLATEEHIARMDAHMQAVDANPAYAALSDRAKLELVHRSYAAEIQAAREAGVKIDEIPGPRRAQPKVDDPAPAKEEPKVEAPKAETKPAEPLKVDPSKKAQPPVTLRQIPSSDAGGVDPGVSGKEAAMARIINSGDPDLIERSILSGIITTRDLENLSITL